VDTSAVLQKALEPVILYRVDGEKGDGKTLAKEFKIHAYPTFIMLNKGGQVIDLWLGYGNSFISTLADARQDLSTIDEKKARYEAKPDLRSSIVLGRYASAMGEYKEAVAYYVKAQALSDDSTQNYYYDIFENTAYGAGKNLFTYEDAVKAGDAALSSALKRPWDAFAISDRMIGLAKANNKPDDVARYITIGLDATANDSDMTSMHSELQVEYALSVKHDTTLAVKYKKDSMPANWQDGVDGLNEFAWWCFLNKADLKEAEQLSDKAVKMAKPGREKANNLDTLAEIKFSLGKSREAIALEQQACKEDPNNAEFAQKVKDFQERADPKK
jgi:tetratricopeptide (TPR) repeat protein